MAAESTIPIEILCIIFEWTCTENLQDYLWRLNSTGEPIINTTISTVTNFPALAISAVCTRWHSIALSSPSLWSQFRVEIAHETGSGGGRFLSILRLYLDRSAGAPLMISVEVKGPIQRNCNSPALNFLLDYTSRWKSFSYTGGCTLDRWMGFSHSFPILESLAIIGANHVDYRNDFDCFKDAPNLRTFTSGDLMSSLPWKYFKYLNVWAKHISLVYEYRDLRILKLWSRQNSFGASRVFLPRLELFTFVESRHRDRLWLRNVFSTFVFPSLTSLVIYSEFTDSELLWPPVDLFTEFISRSACILTTLSLSAVAVSDQDLIATLRLLPSLVNFTINSSVTARNKRPITPHFISSMHASSLTPLLLNLCTLSLTIHDTSFEDTAFVDMIYSRWLSGSLAASLGVVCLRSLVLHFSRRELIDLDEKVYRRLWDLDQMGMRVVVTGRSG